MRQFEPAVFARAGILVAIAVGLLLLVAPVPSSADQGRFAPDGHKASGR